MADNTVLNAGTGGDTVRDLARQAGTIKTQVMQLDIGGATANAEVLVTAGQQTMAASLPVVLASNQASVPVAATLSAETTKVIGTVNVAAAQTIATTNAGTFAVQAAATLAAETTKVIGTVNVAASQTIAVTQSTAASLNATVTNQAITKGTQGATGVTTQDLKDAGRVIFSAATAIAGVTAVTTEALLTMVPQRDGTAAATATSQTVTSGKRLRITSISAGIVSTSAAVLSARISLRIGASGAAVASSPILCTLVIPSGAALAQAGGNAWATFPDGIEFSGAQQLGVTQLASAATGTVWVTLTGFEY